VYVHLAISIAIIGCDEALGSVAVGIDAEHRQRPLQLLGIKLARPVAVKLLKHLPHVARHLRCRLFLAASKIPHQGVELL